MKVSGQIQGSRIGDRIAEKGCRGLFDADKGSVGTIECGQWSELENRINGIGKGVCLCSVYKLFCIM